ncbi:MAG: hypothetical protein QOH58_123 [Thermoleophilaceae bacterium]|jgi:ketosteroid isomerase-like protein|nr:hypothetical protein [Thermoleophilaceae bacterium]
MDSPAGHAEQQDVHPESPNLLVIKDGFRIIVEEGIEAGVATLLTHADDEVQWKPYTGSDRILHGREEVLAYYRAAAESGTKMTLRVMNFHESGDEVVVNGSMRVARPAGGFSESQISWTYRFRDGRILEAAWGPRRMS